MPSAKKIPQDEVKVEAMRYTPPPPEHLTDYAAEEWQRVAPIMVEVGMLTELDLATLALYCESFRTWRHCCAIMARLELEDPKTKGLIVSAPSGAVYMNPIQATKQAAARDLLKYAAQLGLTPSSRAGITVGDRGGTGPKVREPQQRGADLVAKYRL